MNIISKFFIINILSIGIIFQVFSQSTTEVNRDSITSIPVSEILDYQIKAENTFFEADKFLSELPIISEQASAIEELASIIENNEKLFDSIDVDKLSTGRLQKWDREWDEMESRINTISVPINAIILQFETNYNELDSLYKLWLETSINIKNIDIPIEIKESVSKVKVEARSLRKRVKMREGDYITLKHDYNILLNTVSIKRKLLTEARENIVKNLLVAEQPLIWESFIEYYNDTLPIIEHERTEEIVDNITSYTESNPSFIYIILSALILFFIFIRYLQKLIKKNLDTNKVEKTEALGLILDHSFVISLLLTWLVVTVIIFLPVEIRGVIMLVMMIPVLILIRHFFGKQSIVTVITFIVYYLFVSTKFLFYSQSILPRIIYLFVAISSVLVVWYLLKHKNYINRFEKLAWFIRFVLNIEIVVFFISSIFYVLGNVTLATMLLSGAVGVIIAGVILFSIYKLLLSIIQLLLENEYLQKSHIVKRYPAEIRQGMKKIISFIFFIHWANVSLKGFGIKNEVISKLKDIFSHQYEIGSMSFGINNLVAFMLAIYISVWVSRFLLIFLNEEVFVRNKTDKGVTGTITLLLRYSIMALGFLFALGVAGIQLENISIIIGALGVGIGFGLQDIFNNLISGIILALERPIKVDDIIQVGELTGVVKSIGFRSSKIKTYDGSEVIVPNGQIVSNQMINWTLSDRKRRLKIDLGVSYDTNPEEVIEILKEITENHPQVEQNPAPRPRFLGFGDSTLDFQLLFWISDFDNSFGMGTEITIELFKKLKERGIEIPYPKQDITITQVNEKE